MSDFKVCFERYIPRLVSALGKIPLSQVETLADALLNAWIRGRQVFIFGNGGSGGNAVHLANDFLYGISKSILGGLKVHALTANSSEITCLANDEGYERIFDYQLSVLGAEGDVAIALSGSGNSKNILRALECCKTKKITSFAILGYHGGLAKDLADYPIHIPIDDMQISEDLQLIIGHILMQYLYSRKDFQNLNNGASQ